VQWAPHVKGVMELLLHFPPQAYPCCPDTAPQTQRSWELLPHPCNLHTPDH
jgi:hypothetical protein